MRMKAKTRLDRLLLELGLARNLAEAQALIMAGRVEVDGEKIAKNGTRVAVTSQIEISPSPKYVSRGGIKLESALEDFKIGPAGKICLDVGASTGGFTDLLLQSGASKVYALDVGKGLLDWKLRRDPRVIVIEKFNARKLSPKIIPEPIGLATVDVSFISLTLILPALKTVLAQNGEVIALVKPQFELEARLVKGGVVRDEALQLEAVDKIARFASKTGFRVLGQIKAKIKGPKGNQEYFLHLKT